MSETVMQHTNDCDGCQIQFLPGCQVEDAFRKTSSASESLKMLARENPGGKPTLVRAMRDQVAGLLQLRLRLETEKLEGEDRAIASRANRLCRMLEKTEYELLAVVEKRLAASAKKS